MPTLDNYPLKFARLFLSPQILISTDTFFRRFLHVRTERLIAADK